MTDPETRFVGVEYPPLDHVTLYYPGADGGNDFVEIASGDHLPYGSSGVSHRNFIFHLPEYLNGRCIYFKIQSESSLVLPVRFWKADDLIQSTQNEQLVLGAYYGAIIIMLVYNLFLAVSLRNTSYMYYVLYILMYGSYLFVWNGLALRFLWPDNPWWNSIVNPMMVCLTTSLAVLFARSFFLESPVRAPRWSRGLIILAAVGFFSAAFAPFGFSKYVVRVSVLISLVGVFVVLGFAVIQVRGGYRPGRYFLLAFAVLGVGALANILRTAGLLPANFFTLGYGLQATSLAEMVLLSFGLADRYRISEDERRIAQAESAAKTMFIARMSHEIRTPLNAMLGATQLLEETRLDQEQRRYVQLLTSGGRNLLGVVNDVLDLSRITSGRLALEDRPFPLRRMIQEAVRNHEPSARNKGLELFEELAENLPEFVRGDEFRLSRVIGNLLSNAIKFTTKGRVTLAVSVASGTHHQAGEFVDLRFNISDTGIGIPADRLGTIFAEFSQADESVTRRFGGTGLGLAISRGLLEQMGGAIDVHSLPGRGTRFEVRLRLPVAATAEVDATSSASDDDATEDTIESPNSNRKLIENINESVGPPRSGLRILLAEDNEDNRTLFYAFLKHEPHNIDSVENGLEALQKFQEQNYDIVFMDIQMPVMDGLTAVKRIRQWEANQFAAGLRTRRCPVYALSAHAFREEVDRSLQSGCDGHIAKPLVKRTLLDVLATVAE